MGLQKRRFWKFTPPPSGISPTPQYSVQLVQNGRRESSFVYQSQNPGFVANGQPSRITTSLTVERMGELIRVSRASFYRSLKERRPTEEETEVRSTIQQIALGHRRRYGYRRICAEFRRRGMQVNHKRVLRMMRKDNLLALRRRRFMVTTNSGHKFEVYLDLARPMKLSGMDQLWAREI
jgi:hypothetical protein